MTKNTIKNDYYEIAYNDLLYMQMTLGSDFYNRIVVDAQQVTEKMLKSVAELVCVGIERLMHTHNLRALYDTIHEVKPDFYLNRGELSMLKDFYFDAKYPGDNFVVVNRETCEECLDTMYDCIEEVHKVRISLGLPIYSITRKMLSPQ